MNLFPFSRLNHTSTGWLVLIITSSLLLSGCGPVVALMAGGWVLEGAPGVLTESASQGEDKRVRGLTTSHVASVNGIGWIVEPTPPHTPYNFAANYSEGNSGLYLYAMVLNGPSVETKDGVLQIELFLSNDAHSKFSWWPVKDWTKEISTIDIKDVAYVSGNLVVKPVSAISCPRWPGRREPIPENSKLIGVSAGGYQCFRLIFPVDLPSSDSRFSLMVTGIKLGGRVVPDVEFNYERIPN